MGRNFLKDFSAHVAGTKSDKYNEGEIEVVDFIDDKLSLKDYALGCAIKYIVRYTATGEKSGNKADLLKAAHYLMMVYERYEKVPATGCKCVACSDFWGAKLDG